MYFSGHITRSDLFIRKKVNLFGEIFVLQRFHTGLYVRTKTNARTTWPVRTIDAVRMAVNVVTCLLTDI